MKKILLSLAFAFMLTFSADAQPYRDAAGVTLGLDFSGTGAHLTALQWKHFLTHKNNLDIIAGYEFKWGPAVSAVYEWCIPLDGEQNFYLFAGPGVRGGMVMNYNGLGDNCVNFGIAGAIALEYKLARTPLAFSVDWRPNVTWTPAVENKNGLRWKNCGVSVKFYF